MKLQKYCNCIFIIIWFVNHAYFSPTAALRTFQLHGVADDLNAHEPDSDRYSTTTVGFKKEEEEKQLI